MPPDDPDPRLSEVAASLDDEQQRQERRGREPAEQDVLDRRVADAVDLVVAREAKEGVHHRAHEGHADDVPQVRIGDALESLFGEMQPADESGRREARHHAENAVEDRNTYAPDGWSESEPTGGTSKAGCGPKKMRPMKVAVPVASATGRKVRVLTSGIISSMAKITPPIGRVERRRDARARARGDQGDALPGFQPQRSGPGSSPATRRSG